ncbi:dentin sialophosphoprotein [Diachasma alloeum]|uniref:dentin sialophosphoprotein n=1 Tax=Diachasma alloeum TaxID=454923 RepID=UPI00073848A3|nr:dentin sialophosphoprotein [Diachasma alloeum]
MFSKKRRRGDYINARRSSLQVNLSFVSNSSDTSDTEVRNINSKQEILDDNVKRLREAILSKTREIFDNQNDFCKKTASILGEAEGTSDQNDQNQSNSQEKKARLPLVLEESDSSDFFPKPSARREKPSASPIVSSSNKNCTSIVFSPRRTRSSCRSSSKEDTVMGNPIKCSTFTSHNASLMSNPGVRRINNSECVTPKSSKPVIRDVRSCYIPLDKIDGYERVNRSRNLREISMELTPAVGNPILMPQSTAAGINNPVGKPLEGNNESFSSGRTSLEVRTSVDPVLDDPSMSQSQSSRSVLGVRKSNPGRRSLSLNKSNRSLKIIHPAFIESRKKSEFNERKRMSEGNSTGAWGDCLSLNVNTSLVSRRSTNGSVVEATPAPISRSTLMKSQSRFTTVLEKKSTDSGVKREVSRIVTKSNPTTSPEPVPSTSHHRLEDTIILDTSESLKGPIIKDSADESEAESDNPKPRESIYEDSSDDERSETEDNASAKKKQCKRRKLFTQLNDSGLISLSPMERAESSPRTPVLSVKKKKRKIHKILLPKNSQTQAETATQTQKLEVIKSRLKFPKRLEDKKVENKTKKRKIMSKKLVLKKRVNPDVLRLLNEVEGEALDNSEQSRDSLNDFTDNKRIATKGRHHTKCIYIVTTGLCNGDKDLVKAAVKKIGGARMESSVTRQTTHIVTTGVRTINLLRGIIRGCWLVSIEWLKRSIRARTWQSPENYEIDHFSKAVQENRRDREIFGRSYVPELFATCGLIYIDGSTAPPREILKELIKTAGGRIIESPQKAKIVIGAKGLREVWVLDSITTGELQPLDDYRRQ